MNISRIKKYLLSAMIVTLFSLTLFRNIEGIALSEISTFETTSDNTLILYDFPNYNSQIYVNYSQVNITVLFQSQEIDTSDIFAHYSVDSINWTTVALTKTVTLLNNKALFSASLGPFVKAGEYQLKVNATQGSSELATVYYRFNVVDISGIVFLGLSYRIKDQVDLKQYIDIQIDVLGNNIKLGSIYVIADQEEFSEPDKLNLKAGTNHTYWALLGPTNSWEKVIRLTFTANTTTDVQYNNSNFFLLKENAYVPESFWRGKFPAILLGGVFVISMSAIVIMNQRKAPRKFDL